MATLTRGLDEFRCEPLHPPVDIDVIDVHATLGEQLLLDIAIGQNGRTPRRSSRLEAGLRRPTLDQLLPLVRPVRRHPDELVDAPPTGDPRINLYPIPTSDSRNILP